MLHKICAAFQRVKRDRNAVTSGPLPDPLERFSRGDAEGARLADGIAETRASAAFAVERQQRVFVEDIVDIRDQRQAIVEVDPALRLTC